MSPEPRNTPTYADLCKFAPFLHLHLKSLFIATKTNNLSLWISLLSVKKCVNKQVTSVSQDTHHPLQNFSKDNMFAIQPRSRNSRDEELGAVGVFASVGHAEPARAVMLQLEVLIGEPVSIDALACITKIKVR